MTITIYGHIGSRAARCLWAAEECGLAYEWNPVGPADGSSNTPEYRAIHPAGKVPAMTDTGRDGNDTVVMTESMAINLYLAQHHGQGTLWPTRATEQARVLQWTFWAATEIEPFVGALFPHLVLKSVADRDQAAVDGLLQALMPKFGELETVLASRPCVLGDAFTLADLHVSMLTLSLSTRMGVDFTALPNIAAWTQRCGQRPARRKIDALAAAAKR